MGKREDRWEAAKMLFGVVAGALWIYMALQTMDDPTVPEHRKDFLLLMGGMTAALCISNLFFMVKRDREAT